MIDTTIDISKNEGLHQVESLTFKHKKRQAIHLTFSCLCLNYFYSFLSASFLVPFKASKIVCVKSFSSVPYITVDAASVVPKI